MCRNPSVRVVGSESMVVVTMRKTMGEESVVVMTWVGRSGRTGLESLLLLLSRSRSAGRRSGMLG